ncbi:MAG: T9SS C-terminal target domain-containing protein [Ignavibacteriae bacterium]|nr:MAG: T9SS C-terminal target domain-containing protein [Ignavibacteriota bacterium]
MKINKIVSIVFLIIINNIYSQVTQEWVYTHPNLNCVLNISKLMDVDEEGNIFITSRIVNIKDNSSPYSGKIKVIKLSNTGDSIWIRTFLGNDSNMSSEPTSIAVDYEGNIYIAGGFYETSVWGFSDFLLVKYDSSGNLLWYRTYNGSANHSDFATSMVFDKFNNIIITGPSLENGYDYCTIKYLPNGDTAWVRRYNGPGNFDDFSYSVSIDSHNNIYVTGESCGQNYYSYDFATLKYNQTGDLIWINRYNGIMNYDDQAFCVINDNCDNVYVTGTSVEYLYISATIKYDSSGNVKWICKSPCSSYFIDIDSSKNLYIAGGTNGSNNNEDFCTVKIDTAGNVKWLNTYNSIYNDDEEAYSLYVNNTGDVYVTGWSIYDHMNEFIEAVTIKYNTNGNQQWIKFFRNGDTSYNSSKKIIARNNKINVAGFTNVGMFAIQYSELIGINPISNQVSVKYSLSQNYPNPFNPSTKIRFSIPPYQGGKGDGLVKLAIFDILGREITALVNDKLKPGTYEVEWNGSDYPSGIYFYRLISDEEVINTKKLILLK